MKYFNQATLRYNAHQQAWAIAEEITRGWGRADCEAAAESGLPPAVRMAIDDIIAAHRLACSQEQAAREIVARCRIALTEGGPYPLGNVLDVWLIEATAGTPGVSEGTFRYAIVEMAEAATEEEAVAVVGARKWRYSGGCTRVSAKLVRVPVGVPSTGRGAPGTVETPEID